MNESERSELERLKQRHARLELELSQFAAHLRSLEARMAEAQLEELPEIHADPPAPDLPPIPPPRREAPKPPPLPPILPPLPVQPEPVFEQAVEPESEPAAVTPEAFEFAQSVEEPPLAPPIETAPAPAIAPAAPKEKASFEMRLGTYWLVRIGAVLVLTGLVFFGNLAYQKMGAGGKVALLYLASGLLLGAGAWWQRKPLKESLKNYGQVLFAGGLAAVYFTTYAAHHVAPLKVIDSALLDGLLLLGWAGFMAWIADRKKSELLAIFAVSLAYYTSVITPVGGFTLYSNLVLTITAVFFLLRNRWVGLSRASLLATYAGYAYWRFYVGGEGWRWPNADEGLWLGASFLWSYWLIFTLAVFLSKHEGMAGERRAAFLTFNNGAMFTLFLLTMIQVHNHKFWQFALGYGVVLLGLAELARRLFPKEAITKNTYLTQGLLLVTVGIISKFLDTPRTLALVLASESVMLFILGNLRKNIFLQTGAYITAALAVAWGINGLDRDDLQGLWLGAAIGALLVLNACWSHWRMLWADRRELRPVPTYFTFLALVMWAFTTWYYTSHASFGLVLTLEAILLTASIYVLRVPEVPLLGMGYFLLAQTAWSFAVPEFTAREFAMALAANGAALFGVGGHRKIKALESGGYVSAALAIAWGIVGLERNGNAGLAIGAGLAVIMGAMAFWMHRRSAPESNELLRPGPTYFTLLALAMTVATTWYNTQPENFPLALAVEAAALTALVYLVRVREYALLGQGLLLLAHAVWLARFTGGSSQPPWWNSLSLIAITLGLSHWWQKQKIVNGGTTLSNSCQAIYALALIAITCVWLEPHTTPSTWIALTSLLAVGATAYGVVTRAWPLAIAGQIFLFVSGLRLVAAITSHKPDWQFPLAPIAALGLMSFATWVWFARRPESKLEVRRPLLQVAMVYRWVALVMSLWWVCEYIPERERVWVFALVGAVVFALAGWRRNREAGLFGAAFTLAALMTLWLTETREQLVYLPNFLAVLTVLGQQLVARRLPARYEFPKGVHSTVVIIGGITLWRLLSVWVLLGPGGSYLTASWSLLAFGLFACGVLLREKMYRWVGLGILAAALGRVVIFDVWKMETSYRVLSFMALGVVLIVLGFIYIKYEERIRRWL